MVLSVVSIEYYLSMQIYIEKKKTKENRLFSQIQDMK